MQIKDLRDKKILILGLGKEGIVTAKFLREKFPDKKLALADQKILEKFSLEEQKFLSNDGNFDLILGKNYLQRLEEFNTIIKSPGINPRISEIVKAMAAGIKFTSATRIFFANCQGKIVGVTGSKGKSTTSSLIYAVLKEGGCDTELVGNIGKSALEYCKTDNPEKIFVFELSSYQLEDFDGRPDVAVLVSFFPDHLDYHGSLKAYFDAKMRLITNMKKGAKVVYNKASKELVEYVEKKQISIGYEMIAFNDGKDSKVDKNAAWIGKEKLVSSEQIKLLGKHNLENILAAAAVGKIFNIPIETIRKAIEEFNGLEHRLELVGEYKGIRFYNDAISTTPESTMAAIEALGKDQIGTILVGGMNRGYQFRGLAKKILEANIKNIIIFPETGELIWDEMVKLANNKVYLLPQKHKVTEMEKAVKKAFKVTGKNMICLLSNASPSYNLFRNFEDKGKQFKEWVRKEGGEGKEGKY